MKNMNVVQFGSGKLGGHLYAHLKKNLDVDSIHLVPDQKAYLNLKKYESLNPSVVFIAAKDQSLKKLIDKFSNLWPKARLVHFSGFYYDERALGLHPVYSFSKEQEFVDFNKLTYVSDQNLSEDLELLFNKAQVISPEFKKEYHTRISVVSNFTQLMSNLMGKSFSDKTGLSESVLKTLLLQSLESEIKSGESSFTGPWVRNEKQEQDKQVQKSEDHLLIKLNETFNEFIKEYKRSSK